MEKALWDGSLEMGHDEVVMPHRATAITVSSVIMFFSAPVTVCVSAAKSANVLFHYEKIQDVRLWSE